ncbi:phosphocholine-specific phospholipase C [Acidicapsa ligni]|uniref:phosphocholine-specific phospholipase C n=1 Tax=Acidicapsa ligni TaxID=542300 RepID=UPI0021DF46DB|nr:phospholipase C, phosphocholine-specific [Acidicapsa ligni]
MKTRRDFLKLAAMLSGAAGTSGLIPESIKRAYAIEPAHGSTYLDAEHIVILMQENRSFDHSLGSLQGVRGFNDPRAIRLGNGNSVFVQTDAAGNSYAPWRLDIKDTRITWMGSVPHSRNSQVDAWNDGRHDGWIDAKRSHVPGYGDIPLTMGHYTREDIPFYYALADAFTVCDQNYCSVMTSTTPNRSCFWTGTVRDEQRADSKVFMRNDELERGGMTWKTFPERLHEAGVSWKFYQNELTHSGGLTDEEHVWLSNFGCNLLENFSAYNVEAYPGAVSGMQERLNAMTHQVQEMEHRLSTEQNAQSVAVLHTRLQHAQERIERLKAGLENSGEARYQKMNKSERALHDAAFTTNSGDPHYRSLEEISFEDQSKQQQMMVPKGDVLYQFRKDVNEGTLPTVSWLSGPEKFSDHPTSPWYGAWYVSEIVDILTKNPEVWKKTIFILTYDENDGYFDHAPSFVAADPKRPETGRASEGIDTGLEYTYAKDELDQGVSEQDARSGPIGMGFRVPMIIASPWTRGGWVNSQLFDHTSTLMFLENFIENKYGNTVKEENISAWRRSISGNLISSFRPHNEQAGSIKFLNRDQFVIGIQKARYKEIPSNYKKLSAAEIETINKNGSSDLTSRQEKGVRPACALPYELYADGLASPDGTKFQLRMTAGNLVHGSRSAGAPFNVYLRHSATEMAVATYAVKPGDTITEEFALSAFPQGRYLIDVHGPNGFHRSFAGEPATQQLQIKTAYEKKNGRLTGNIEVLLQNQSDKPLGITLADLSYKADAVRKTITARHQESIILPLKRSHNWYDFTVKVEGLPGEVRYAGRVETGLSSFTDPLMGDVV